jgi:hypothetical protein
MEARNRQRPGLEINGGKAAMVPESADLFRNSVGSAMDLGDRN